MFELQLISNLLTAIIGTIVILFALLLTSRIVYFDKGIIEARKDNEERLKDNRNRITGLFQFVFDSENRADIPRATARMEQLNGELSGIKSIFNDLKNLSAVNRRLFKWDIATIIAPILIGVYFIGSLDLNLTTLFVVLYTGIPAIDLNDTVRFWDKYQKIRHRV